MKNSLNCQEWKKFLMNATNHLFNSKNELNTLNFFPIPDADTGTNMYITMQGVVDAIKDYSKDDLSRFSNLVSEAAMYSSKGNSGVILSQILKGLCDHFAKIREIKVYDVLSGIILAKKYAYHAISKPVEGTILTVVNVLYDYAKKHLNKKTIAEVNKSLTLLDLFTALSKKASLSAWSTANMMPEINTEHLADSGAVGLFRIFEAFETSVFGEVIELNKTNLMSDPDVNQEIVHDLSNVGSFGYCTEMICNLHFNHNFVRKGFLTHLKNLNCNSIVCTQTKKKVKLHAHTLTPGDLLNYVQTFGSLDKIKIDNMSLQALETYKPMKLPDLYSEEQKDIAIVAIAHGQGLVVFFQQFNLDYVICIDNHGDLDYEELEKALNKIKAKKIVLFPNDYRIAKDIKQWLKKIKIPTSHIQTVDCFNSVRAICVLLNAQLSTTFNELLIEYNYAVEGLFDFTICGVEHLPKKHFPKTQAKFFAINDKQEILCSNDDYFACIKKVLDENIDEDNEILTMVYGYDVSNYDVERIKEYISSKFDLKLEVIPGLQKNSFFEFSIE